VNVSVCGYAVDVVRSCYSSRWNFPDVGEVRGYYYFCGEDQPFYPGWSFFGSRNWHKGDGTPWPEFGELENVKQKWRDGSFATTQPALVTIGSGPQIAGDLPGPPDRPTQLVAGVDIRCWIPPYKWANPAAGGDQVGGEADSHQVFPSAAAGGDQVGGEADSHQVFPSAAAGGDVAGGYSSWALIVTAPAAGGDQVGGSSMSAIAVTTSGLGGDVTGGSGAHAIGFITSAMGGGSTGGTASHNIIYNDPARGGVAVNGTATGIKVP
jgi:hypothetical protein